MKPCRFSYFRPDTVDAAVACLRAGEGRARALAGGQSLLALMNRRAIRPAALVDLGRLTDLRYLAREGGALRVGALTTHAQLESGTGPAGSPGYAVLAEAARLIGHLPVRTRGTFGGSIAHADPRSEWCLLAVLLDADVTVRGHAGTRVIPAADFFTGAHQTAAGWDELVTEIRFPRPVPGTALAESGPQPGQFPLVAAAASVDLGSDGTIIAASIALGGITGRPIRVPDAEQALLGCVPGRPLLDHCGQVLAKQLHPQADKDADAQYRAELAVVLAGRALRAAIARSAAGREIA